jgi:hypothetical protein
MYFRIDGTGYTPYQLCKTQPKPVGEALFFVIRLILDYFLYFGQDF